MQHCSNSTIWPVDGAAIIKVCVLCLDAWHCMHDALLCIRLVLTQFLFSRNLKWGRTMQPHLCCLAFFHYNDYQGVDSPTYVRLQQFFSSHCTRTVTKKMNQVYKMQAVFDTAQIDSTTEEQISR